MERAILDYEMIQDGDRVLVAISGGAGSFFLHSFSPVPR